MTDLPQGRVTRRRAELFDVTPAAGGVSPTTGSGADRFSGPATGDERAKLFQGVFAKVHDDVIADVPMYHMIGYTRVGQRIEGWRPTLKTNSEIRLSEIDLKD